MSADIYGCCSGTVVTPWAMQTPESGKSHHELKLKLDDAVRAGRRFGGRNVAVKSYERVDFLPHVSEGCRVFVTGTVQAKAYLAKATGQPAAFMTIYAETVTVEGSPPHSETVAPTRPAPTATVRVPAPTPARKVTDPLNGPVDDDEPPF